MDIIMAGLGVLLSGFPYICWAMTLMWSCLRCSRAHAYTVMAATTALHALSIILLTYYSETT